LAGDLVCPPGTRSRARARRHGVAGIDAQRRCQRPRQVLEQADGILTGGRAAARTEERDGISGWAAYSYGRTRYTDPARDETFWGDFDQRHAINLSGAYHISDRTSLAATFRGGSNFPIPGYFVEREGGLFLGSHPNDVRLPHYARLDVRATRTFHAAGRRATLFVEVVNLLNRTNLGLANGAIRPETGEAVGFTERLFKRLPSAGLLVEF
jgi:hypothetical protein